MAKPRRRKLRGLIVEVHGGVVQGVMKNEKQVFYHLIDWDNLLGDGVDTAQSWAALSEVERGFIRARRTSEYRAIRARLETTADGITILPKEVTQ